MTIDQSIGAYLVAPDTRMVVVAQLSRTPQDSFAAILGYQGPYPKGMHPVDAHEVHLVDLLSELLKQCPELLIGPSPATIPPNSYILVAAAISTADPRFSKPILLALGDRSIYMKLAAIHGILTLDYLRTPDVKERLLKLLEMRSISRDAYAIGRIREALARFA